MHGKSVTGTLPPPGTDVIISIREPRRGRHTWVIENTSYRPILRTRKHWPDIQEAFTAAENEIRERGWIDKTDPYSD